jgi:hypothetical protein
LLEVRMTLCFANAACLCSDFVDHLACWPAIFYLFQVTLILAVFHSTLPWEFQDQLVHFFPSFFCFASTGVWTWGLMLARQVITHLSHSASSFLCWVFSR